MDLIEDTVDNCMYEESTEHVQSTSQEQKAADIPQSSIVLVDDSFQSKAVQDDKDISVQSYDYFIASTDSEQLGNIYVSIFLIISDRMLDNERLLSTLSLATKKYILARKEFFKVKDENFDDGISLVLVSKRKVSESSPLSKLSTLAVPEGLNPAFFRKIKHDHGARIKKMVDDQLSFDTNNVFTGDITVQMKDGYPYPANPVTPPDDKTMTYIQEMLEDHTSFLRQHLTQLYGLTNVRIKEMKELNGRKPGIFTVEFRPTDFTKLQNFTTAMGNGHIRKVITDELKKLPGNVLRGKAIRTQIDQNKINKLYIRHEEDKRLAGGNQTLKSLKLHSDGPNNHGIVVAYNYAINSKSHPTTDSKKRSIVLGIIERIISNPKSTSDELHKVLRRYPDTVLDVHNDKGHGPLHMLVQAQRGDLMSAVVYSGLWDDLRTSVVVIPEGSGVPPHYGYTPRRLAESISIKGKGYKILVEYDKHEEIVQYWSSLSKVCSQGKLPLIREYLKVNPSVLNKVDKTGHTALLVACACGQIDIVKFLLSKDVTTDMITNEKAGCLHLACKFGHTELLGVLLASGHWDISLVDSSGYAAIEYAAMNGDVESLKIWSQKYNLTGRCLVVASQYTRDKAVDYLLDVYEMNPNKGFDEEGHTAVSYAVINNNDKLLKQLLDHKAEIDMENVYHKNILHLIAQSKSDDVIEIVVEAAQAKGCLKQLVNSTDVFVGQELLQIIRGKDKRRRAWHWVELHRHLLHAFKTKMASGQIDVARYGTIRSCGFGFAPDKESRKKMDDLKQERLNKAQSDMTPLHAAVNRDNTNMAQVLLNNGADPNRKDHFGMTPAHLAAMRGNLQVLNMLERAGGKLELPSKEGHTPERLAEENGHMTIVNFLQAENTMQHARKFLGRLKETESKFDDRVLDTERSNGQDIRRYLINILRDLMIDINTSLLELNSGPVMEESVTDPTSITSELV